jgi:hypothetical protein
MGTRMAVAQAQQSCREALKRNRALFKNAGESLAFDWSRPCPVTQARQNGNASHGIGDLEMDGVRSSYCD